VHKSWQLIYRQEGVPQSNICKPIKHNPLLKTTTMAKY